MIMQILSPFFFILALYVMNEVLSNTSKENLYDDRTEPSMCTACRIVCHSPLERCETEPTPEPERVGQIPRCIVGSNKGAHNAASPALKCRS